MSRRAARLISTAFATVLALAAPARSGRAQTNADSGHPARPAATADVPDEQVDLPRFALARIGGSRFSAPNEPASLVISPDGRQLVVAGVGREVCLFDSTSGRRLGQFIGAEEGNLQISFSPDGQHLAAAGYDGMVRIWNPASGARETEFRAHGAPVRFAGFVPSAKRLVTAGADGFVRFWNAQTFDLVESYHIDDGAGDRRMAIDDRLGAVYWGVSGRVVRWDPGTVKAPFELRTKYSPLALQMASEAKMLCVLSKARDAESTAVQLFDAGTAKELRSFEGSPLAFTAATLSPNGRHLATGSEGPTGGKLASALRVLDWQTKKVIWERALADCVDPQCLTFSPDGTRLYVSFGGNLIRIYDAADGRELFTQTHECRDITCVSFGHSGQQLLIASGTHLKDRRGRVSLWDFDARRCRPRWQVDCGYTWSASLSPDDRRVASHSLDGRLTMRDARDGRPIWEGPALGEGQLAMSRKIFFRGGGEQLLLPEVSGSVRLIAAEKGSDLKTATAGPYVHDAALSQSGGLLALAKSDATVALWDVEAGRIGASLDEHGAKVFCVAFAPEDRFLVSGGRDKRLRVWDLKQGKSRLNLAGHESGIVAIGVSPDGETIVSSDESSKLIIWDARDGRMIYQWNNEGPVTSLSLSPDGERLATSNGRGRVLVWDYRQLRATGAAGGSREARRTDSPLPK